MGRAREYRQRLKYTVSSARQKTLEQQLEVQLTAELGMSLVEARLLAGRLSPWILTRPELLGPNQIAFDEAVAGRESFSRGPTPVTRTIKLTPFDLEDLELEEEFGLPALQLGRVLRLVEEADRQDALLSARQLTLLCNIAPSSLRRRLQRVRRLGIWVPVRGLGQLERDQGGLYRSTWVLSAYLQGKAVEALRRQGAIARARLGELVRQFLTLAQRLGEGEAGPENSEQWQWAALVKACPPERLAALAAGRLAGGNGACDWVAFSRQLQADFALSPARLQAITELVAEVTSSLGSDRVPGQVIYWAVAADEPAGKPLSSCRLVPVRLLYWDRSDDPDRSGNRDANRVQDLKLARIQRFAQAAKEAGAYLSYADLSYLLGIHTAALSRMVREHQPGSVPLRGSECDIGRGITHRARVIELYLEMHTETEIVARTGHSYESIENYLRDFATVLVLSERGLTPTMIR
ncbi:MAG TPA: hypothetical protein DEQ28_05440, partial [Clostridiales bacterium]|nr:hypothetical protein [Clostridiales bacterium]